MEFWNWDSFWGEFSPPILAAAVVLWGLAVIATWAWKRNWRTIFWGVAFLTTFFVIQILFSAMQPNIESERPYFTKSRTSIYRVTTVDGKKTSNWFLTVTVQNNDKPAKNVINQVLILGNKMDPTVRPLRTRRVRNANDIGRFQTLSHHEPVTVGSNTRPAFVIFEIKYADALSDESYSQIWFMKFAGSRGGTFTPTLFEATQDQRTKIEAYIRQRNIPMLASLDGAH